MGKTVAMSDMIAEARAKGQRCFLIVLTLLHHQRDEFAGDEWEGDENRGQHNARHRENNLDVIVA